MKLSENLMILAQVVCKLRIYYTSSRSHIWTTNTTELLQSLHLIKKSIKEPGLVLTFMLKIHEQLWVRSDTYRRQEFVFDLLGILH